MFYAYRQPIRFIRGFIGTQLDRDDKNLSCVIHLLDKIKILYTIKQEIPKDTLGSSTFRPNNNNNILCI